MLKKSEKTTIIRGFFDVVIRLCAYILTITILLMLFLALPDKLPS